MTGRHMTVRVRWQQHRPAWPSADRSSTATPPSGFNEKDGHPGNICWPQALEANKVFEMLDGKQREKALVAQLPAEQAVGFRGKDGKFPGIAVTELSADQKEQVQKTRASSCSSRIARPIATKSSTA